MKKKLLPGILFTILLSIAVFAYNGDTSVFITDSGTKYHSYGCSYLESVNETTLKKAVESGYTPCSRCNPPIPDFDYTVLHELPESSSGSNSSSRNVPQKDGSTSNVKPTSNKTTNQTKKNDDKESDMKCFLIGLLLGVIAASIIWLRIKWKSDDGWMNSLQRERDISSKSREIIKQSENEIKNLKRELSDETQKAIDRKNDLSDLANMFLTPEVLLPLSGAPEGHSINLADDCPCSPGDPPWGSAYTFYIASLAASCYHSQSGCCGAKTKINAETLRFLEMRPCTKCNPKLPDLAWYYKYQKLVGLMNRYKKN